MDFVVGEVKKGARVCVGEYVNCGTEVHKVDRWLQNELGTEVLNAMLIVITPKIEKK